MGSTSNCLLCFMLCTLLFSAVASRSRVSHQTTEADADRVGDLPGQPKVEFKHYAGYVKLRPNDHKALFYWFFEAQKGVSSKPLVLWLNGGPGCSSIAYGAAQELGPFLVGGDGSRLKFNKYSWNKAANMLFLEAPVGVGFSYTNNSEDLHKLGDQVTANDSYAFLIGWFKRFPNFKSHDFYIAGESYAGHYVPQLAELIHERNIGAGKDSFINLKGFMIGNAVINDPTDTKGLVDYAWSHAIISDKLYKDISKECDFGQSMIRSNCNDHIRGFVEAYAEIDIYSIYSPVCLDSLDGKAPPKLMVAPHLLTQHDLWHRLPSGYDPCAEDYVMKFFNREDVQRALHANITKLSYPYTTCSGVISKWNDSAETVLPIIQKLLNAGFRIWVYSGDTDGRVPVTSTRYSINKMGLKIKEEWRAWFHKHQVAGWVETYEKGLTLVTVRGAGHQVPAFAPAQSLSLFTNGVISKWNDSAETVLPIIQKLLNAGFRIWVYSGDTDGRVPVTSTRYSINKMGLKIKEEWRAWFHKHQVAGWVETYEKGLTLVTVRGAGHQVPAFAPAQSLSLFTKFLSAATLPSARF